jgi:hypothetical protein
MSKAEQIKFGSRYGNLANKLVGVNIDGKFCTGSAKRPPMEAVKISVNTARSKKGKVSYGQ